MLRRPRLMCSKSYGGCTAEGVSVSKVALPPTTHSTQIDHAGSFRGKYQGKKNIAEMCPAHSQKVNTTLVMLLPETGFAAVSASWCTTPTRSRLGGSKSVEMQVGSFFERD